GEDAAPGRREAERRDQPGARRSGGVQAPAGGRHRSHAGHDAGAGHGVRQGGAREVGAHHQGVRRGAGLKTIGERLDQEADYLNGADYAALAKKTYEEERETVTRLGLKM